MILLQQFTSLEQKAISRKFIFAPAVIAEPRVPRLHLMLE
jgi:hypothetical protein